MPKQSEGRTKNGAVPGGKPSPDVSDDAVKAVGQKARTAAGPDGPDAGEIGETFKNNPGRDASRTQ